MILGKVNLISIKLIKYDRVADSFEYELVYNIEGVLRRFVRKGAPKNSDVMVEDIINELRNLNKEKVEVWDNSTLDTFSRMDTEDIDNVRKHLMYFFRRVTDKITEFKQNKSADGYLARYNSIVGFSIKFNVLNIFPPFIITKKDGKD